VNVLELLATLKAKDIQLAVTDEQLRVNGNKQALSDPALLAALREHKPALIELIKAGQYSATRVGQIDVPANGILSGTTHITPAMVTLADVDQPTLDRLIAEVPGGAANVQDIYPWRRCRKAFSITTRAMSRAIRTSCNRTSRSAAVSALQDFARAVAKGHRSPRHPAHGGALGRAGRAAASGLASSTVAGGRGRGGDGESAVLQQLHERFDARHFRLDVKHAPMMRLAYAWDEDGQRVVATLLFHHMALDHSALDVVRHELLACLTGQDQSLGRPVPFRNYVAQARLGISETEHEAFFREMLADIAEPTLPYGLQDVQGDGLGIAELSLPINPLLGQRLRAQARQLGVSVASLFHLGWAQVLATLTGKQECGIRHGADGAYARRRSHRAGAGDFHQYLAAAGRCRCARRACGGGGDPQTPDHADAPRTRATGTGPALQRRGRADAVVQCLAQLPSQPHGGDGQC
jgi:arthrofactin-type cyclic lipopeptide synthetase C